ncbi:hypothetical protein AXA44_05645 [Rhodococcus sp. SC4]|nr:hypothetical protein AXA44_05645 [Rhodococcus sp. SC4]KXX55965.1 hypothetical protein AZG88_16945 [Rhodococcus sp. LB1]
MQAHEEPPAAEEEGGVPGHERRTASQPRGTGQGAWLPLGAVEPGAAWMPGTRRRAGLLASGTKSFARVTTQLAAV